MKEWKPLVELIREPGQSWSGRVTCFKTNPLESTLLAQWDLGYKEPWLILTDLQPNQADVLWYGLRPSTECVYRDVKSDGWQWQNTRLINPQRAERLWLAIAVSTLWMVMLGGESELNAFSTHPELLPPQHYFLTKPRKHQPLRLLSCFLLGCITLISDLLNHVPIHLNRWSSFPANPVEHFYCPNSS
ncbi:transposase [Calothrix sp. NIES-4101]|nr:transposase [Calothrix sp. NIES-4101]